jgi:hypothetical protein
MEGAFNVRVTGKAPIDKGLCHSYLSTNSSCASRASAALQLPEKYRISGRDRDQIQPGGIQRNAGGTGLRTFS